MESLVYINEIVGLRLLKYERKQAAGARMTSLQAATLPVFTVNRLMAMDLFKESSGLYVHRALESLPTDGYTRERDRMRPPHFVTTLIIFDR